MHPARCPGAHASLPGVWGRHAPSGRRRGRARPQFCAIWGARAAASHPYKAHSAERGQRRWLGSCGSTPHLQRGPGASTRPAPTYGRSASPRPSPVSRGPAACVLKRSAQRGSATQEIRHCPDRPRPAWPGGMHPARCPGAHASLPGVWGRHAPSGGRGGRRPPAILRRSPPQQGARGAAPTRNSAPQPTPAGGAGGGAHPQFCAAAHPSGGCGGPRPPAVLRRSPPQQGARGAAPTRNSAPPATPAGSTGGSARPQPGAAGHPSGGCGGWSHPAVLSLPHSTVTLLARLRGWSTSAPRRTAT
jgi:hypothetical protein